MNSGRIEAPAPGHHAVLYARRHATLPHGSCPLSSSITRPPDCGLSRRASHTLTTNTQIYHKIPAHANLPVPRDVDTYIRAADRYKRARAAVPPDRRWLIRADMAPAGGGPPVDALAMSIVYWENKVRAA